MILSGLAHLIIVGGALLVALGLILLLVGKVPLLARLSGHFVARQDGFTLNALLTTMIIIRLVVTILLNLVFRFLR